MTILVDAAIWPWRGAKWAHLVSDESYDELHDFARALGLARRTFQGDHYDISEHDRARAIDLGAKPVDGRELVRRLIDSGLRHRGRTSASSRGVRRIHSRYRRRMTEEAPPLDDLLAAIAIVGPIAEKYAAESETNGHLSAEVVEEFHRHELFRLKSPRDLGGFEVAPDAFMDVLAALAYHDTSAAWNLTIGSSSTAFAGGYLPDEGAAQVFAGDMFPVLAGQVAPNGTATAVDGGYVVNGRWGFGSGIKQAQFALGGVRVGEREARIVFMPIDEVTVDLESWDTAGLRGTGSYDYSVNDLFVSDDMTADLLDLRPRRGGPVFAQSIDVFVANEIPAFVVGALHRAIDELVAIADGTTRFMASSSLAERTAFQAAVGRAEARLAGIRSLAYDRVGAAWTEVTAEGRVTHSTAAALHSANTLICEDATATLSELYRFGGGRVIKSSHPVQRIVRDVMAAAQHVTVSNEHYERAGRLRLGID